MIKAVVFDFDGMFANEGGRFSEKFVQRYGIPMEKVTEFFKREFGDCLIGKADLKEEFSKYLEEWGLADVSWEEIEDLWFREGVVIEDQMIELIKKLKAKGIVCVMASNNEKQKKVFFNENYAMSEIFDHVIFSCDAKAKKPNEEFVKYMLERVQLAPEEILFCDDREDNIEELRKRGFNTHMYTNLDSFLMKLRKLGVEI